MQVVLILCLICLLLFVRSPNLNMHLHLFTGNDDIHCVETERVIQRGSNTCDMC